MIRGPAQYLLGITSLWMLAPVLSVGTRPMANWSGVWLTVAMAVVSAVSTTMWFRYRTEGALYSADLWCARALFVLLVVFHAGQLGPRPLNAISQILFPSAVLGLYALASRPGGWMSHLLFRYVGFWWSWQAVTETTATGVLVHSTLYWGHILYSLWWTQKVRCFRAEEHYFAGCTEVVLMILLLALAGYC